MRVNPQGGAVLAGRAAPGALIIVRSNNQEIGRVRADAQGQWVLVIDTPLPPGGQEITVAALDAAGRQTVGDRPVLVVVPDRPAPGAVAQAARPPSGPASADPAPGTTPPAGPIVVLTAPLAAPQLLQGPTAGRGPARLGLEIVDYDAAGEIRFAGTAPVGGRVRLYVDDAFVGEAEVDAAGRWSMAPGTRVPVGEHRLRLDQVDPAGRVARRTEVPFQRAAVVGLEAGANRVVVQPRQNLWRIARSAYGQGLRYTDIFAANRDQIADPNRIYPGQVFAIPAGAAPVVSTPPSAIRSR